ncbi:MAG: YceI family protein [Bacteriovoracaceae bacterium]
MKKLLCLLSLFVSFSAFAQSASTWEMKSSLVKYTIKHLLKTAMGESKEIKGKGACDKGNCEFLLAVAVKSFDSGNTNRDLHMLEVMKGAKFPFVVARVNIPEASLKSKSWKGDLELEMSGVKKMVPVTLEIAEDKGFIHGDFIFKCTDFGIERPSFLTMAIDDEVQMTVNTQWVKK